MMHTIASRQIEVDAQPLHDLMVVSIDGMSMLIPREDIKTFESVHDIDTQEPNKNSIGWLRYLGIKMPVYAFTNDFEIITTSSTKKPICVLLNRVDIGLLCDEIKTLACSSVEISPLPECMEVSGTPVESFCLYKNENGNDNKIGMLYRSESIKRYIDKVSF